MGAVHPEDRAALAAARDATASEDRAFQHSFRIVRATGECLWVTARAAALRDTTGRITGYVGTVEDISQQKQTEAQLILSRDRALEAARLKSEFLGNMSHEIRTPLNGILGMTELLSDSALTDEQRDYLNVVRSSGEALYKVASDILDFSSIETGKLRLKPSPFSLHNTVAEACRSLRGHAQEKQLELTCETAADLPPGVLGDADCLRKVLLNLIGNAIKFTAAGSVRVGVCYRGGIGGLGLSASSHSETEMHQIEFSVTDTGIGIPAEKQGLIFEAFTQADGSTTRRFGGTGLGLAISSQLVSAMGGRIHVESEPGRGSTFRFTLPFELAEVVTERAARPSSTLTRTISTADTTAVASATAAAGTASATAASSTTRNGPTPLAQIPTAGATGPLAPVADGSQRTLRVLLAEDTPVNSLLATAILKSRGHEVTSVENGRDALVRLNDGTYDLVLMDVQMPIMNGLEAAAAIRLGEAGSGRHVAIIALTAHAMAGDRERCLAAGMDGYVSKPFKPAQVLAEIERVMALGDAQGSEDRAA
jgi:signal transduction histidine kinase/ActR/RegA family two-component response regulator